MDFVHDTLADGRPFRILTVVDNWSRHSPILEAGFRMTGETVGQVLDRVLDEGQRLRSITVDPGTEFQSRAFTTSPSFGGCQPSTSFQFSLVQFYGRTWTSTARGSVDSKTEDLTVFEPR